MTTLATGAVQSRRTCPTMSQTQRLVVPQRSLVHSARSDFAPGILDGDLGIDLAPRNGDHRLDISEPGLVFGPLGIETGDLRSERFGDLHQLDRLLLELVLTGPQEPVILL